MVDLNADVGEDALAPAEERRLLEVVTSASVSCGAHAGSPDGIARTLQVATETGVVIGAHPSYPDRAGFGRRPLDMAPGALAASLSEQIASLSAMAERLGARLRYVKPHGALYHRACMDRSTAQLVARVAAEAGVPTLLLAAGAPAAEAATAAGVTVCGEAFADRAYRSDGTLVDRADEGAVLVDPEAVVAQALALVLDGNVDTVDGGVLDLRPSSLCVHGDTPGAAETARLLRAALDAAGVQVAPFAR